MGEVIGGCLCGQVRFSAKGTPDRVGICHCMACRKHHGALFYASAVYADTAVQIEGPYHHYEGRAFCPTCGSSVFSRSDGEIELHLGALDAPSQMKPTYELWAQRRENWLPDFPDATLYEANRESD